jgi:tetratricopeptide (TPR) repeat protein
MAIKGSLKEASLADVCQLLALGQKSGCLSVTDASRFGQIYFDAGRINYARIVNRRDRLGDLLVRDGRLHQAQLDEVLQLQALEPDRRLGELLLARSYITLDDLSQYVRMQIEEAIYHLFTWTRGNFFFEVDARSHDADIRVSINPETLLLEAARRVDEWSLIEKKIPSLDLVFDVEHERLRSAGVELTAEQEQVLDLTNGDLTVQEIIDRSGLTEFETGKALYGLVQAGFAHRVGRKEEDAARGHGAEEQERRNLGVAFYHSNMLEDALREFDRVLALNPADHVARYHVALVRLRQGRLRDAARQLRVLLQERGPHYGAFLNLALVLRLQGRLADSLLVLDEADGMRPRRPSAQLARGMTLMQAGRHLDARSAFMEYRARLHADTVPAARWFYFHALNLALLSELAEAEAVLVAGLEVHPESAPLLLLSGLVRERHGDLSAAEKAYRNALGADSSIPQLYKNIGDVTYRRGAHEESLTSYMRAIELDPELGDDVYAKIGNVMYKSRNRDAAMGYWKKALQLNPQNMIVRNNIEIVSDAAG